MKTFRRYLLALTLTLSMSSAWGAPIITQQPQDQTVVLGTTATFSVGATGNGPLHYQWRAYTTATNFVNLPDAAGDTGLNIAVRAGHIDVVRLLLGRGADPNRRGADGMSPLMRATLADDRWMARLLLRQGADPEQPDASGQRPLFAAIKFRRDAITVELLQADADIEIENSEHMSALTNAIVEGDMPALQLMLTRGARINREDEEGRTPLFWALFCKHYDQARLLFSAGARLGQQNIALPADWPENAGNRLPDDGQRTAIGRVGSGWQQ